MFDSLRAVVELSLCLKYSRRRGVAWTNVFTFAESCTGGLVSALLTSVPGVSAVFPGSVVTYSDRAKIERLAVAPETLARHGAVSPQCAAEMAFGAMRLFDTVMAVSITGVAGPGGGSIEKPVGTVWFAIAHASGRVILRRGLYPNRPREAVRLRAARAALAMLEDGLRREME
jgi:PncC family amidohydrolase